MSKARGKDANLPLQAEGFLDAGLSPVMAMFVTEIIMKAEDTYSRLLLLLESVSGDRKETLMVLVQKLEPLPRELSTSFLAK
ncbi:hypothetical protein HYZ99_05650 [Candidatus Peregrinibacteria bacterium]|nr:hypothetical protein [Candidatus Peregrinibacteria bacterium]